MTSQNLMNVILSMDSYNRGYTPNVVLDGDSFGLAKIKVINAQGLALDSSILGSSQTGFLDDEIGFYAITYEYGGKTVISFRGTDDVDGFGDVFGSLDRQYGWGLGAGSITSEQARMAIEFYQLVAGNYSSDVVLTGHSLGGGLAGYVAALYGKNANVYDSMTFELGAKNTANYTITLVNDLGGGLSVEVKPSELSTYMPPSGYSIINITPKASSDLIDLVYGASNQWDYNLAGIKGYYLEGEVLASMLPLRSGVAELHEYDLGFSTWGPDGIDSFDLHSISSLVMRIYASELSTTSKWSNASQYFWPILYDKNFALGISGISQHPGQYASGDKWDDILRVALAYSAINDGDNNAKPFGDTGIAALFNDANDLGGLLEGNNASERIQEYATDISKVFVQFAGSLALNKVLQGIFTDAKDGALTFSDAANTLTLSFNATLWANAEASIAGLTSREDIFNHIVTDSGDAGKLAAYMTSLWGNATSEAIEHIVFATGNTGNSQMSDFVSDKADIFIGGDSHDLILGSANDNLIFGFDGNDTINAGNGDDIIYGGVGRDTINPGDGSNIVDGGSDFDTVDYSTLETAIEVSLSGTKNAAAVSKLIEGKEDILTNIEFIKGTSADDVFYLGNGSNGIVIDGGGGSDTYVLDATGQKPIEVKVIDPTGGGVLVVIGYRPDNTKATKNSDGSVTLTPDDPGKPPITLAPSNNGQIPINKVNPGGGADIPLEDYFRPDDDSPKSEPPANPAGGAHDGNGHPIVAANNPYSPLILDLNNDGAKSINLGAFINKSSVYFDMDNDGFAERTAWVSAEDGLLAIDTNSNGKIDNQSELFGNSDIYADGFLKLASLDSNSDNAITSADSSFSNLRVWVDANQNGQTDAGELKTLAEMNITSIDLNAIALTNTTVNENDVSATSTFVMNGTSHEIADHWFRVDQADSIYNGNSVLTAEALYLPTLKGSGNVQDLRHAMSEDPVLLQMVSELTMDWTYEFFVNNPDNVVREQVKQILFRWAGVDDVNPSDPVPGFNYNAQENAFFENFFGTPSSGGEQSQALNYLVDKFQTALLVQAGAGKIFDNLYYDIGTGDLKGGGALNVSAVEDLSILVSGLNAIEAGSFWRGFSQLLLAVKPMEEFSSAELGAIQDLWSASAHNPYDSGIWTQYASGYGVGSSFFFNGTDRSDLLVGSERGSDEILGHEGDDYIYGLGGHDTLDGGEGYNYLFGGTGGDWLKGTLGSGNYYDGGKDNDLLSGSYGDDTYIYRLGDGVDNYSEIGGDDVIIMGEGFDADDFSWVQDGNDLDLYMSSVKFAKIVSFFIGASYQIETIKFFDNTVISLIELDPNDGSPPTSISGTSGNDYLYGDSVANIFISDTGNDTMYGNAGNDTYFFAPGFSQDTIYEYASEGTDTIVMQGYIPSDIRLWTDTYGNLYIQSKLDSGDRIMVAAGYEGNSESLVRDSVETIQFTNSTSIDLTSGLTLEGDASTDFLYGTQFNDTLLGLSGNDVLNGNRGNDVLIGGSGNDDLYGGAGDDTYRFDTGFGMDTVHESESEGMDTIRLENVSSQNIRLWTDTYGNAYLTNKLNGDQITLLASYEYNSESSIRNYVEKVVFDDATIWDLTSGLTLEGDASTDFLYGTQFNDTLLGLSGDDYLYGNRGNDIIIGGSGNDYLYGGAGDDTYKFSAGSGTDYITEYISEGSDKIKVIGIEADNIRLWTDSYGTLHLENKLDAADHIVVNASYGTNYESLIGDYVESIEFDDATVWDLTGGLKIEGSNVGESLYATANNDTIYGFEGDDYITAGAGDDVIIGGAGSDTIYGGYGADKFVFDSASLGSSDNINDFSLSEGDRLDISQILFGYDPLTSLINDFVSITDDGYNSVISVDRDGTGLAYSSQSVAMLSNVVGLDAEAMLTSGNLIA